jgi:hypothetical protein
MGLYPQYIVEICVICYWGGVVRCEMVSCKMVV